MFKYKYLKRLFFEAALLAAVCFAAAVVFFVNGSDIEKSINLIIIVAACGVMSVMLCVFTALYSKLYRSFEDVMDMANMHCVILRPKKKRIIVYGSLSFVSKFSDILPQKPEITLDEQESFLQKLCSCTDEQGGEKFYRYSFVNDDGEDEDVWVKVERMDYHGTNSVIVINVTDIYLQKLYLIQSDYYDSSSRLLNREAVLKRVAKFIDDGCSMGCYAVLSVAGLEKTVGKTAADADKTISQISSEFKKLESKNVIVGKTSHNKFLFFFAGIKINANDELKRLTGIAESIISQAGMSARLSVFCGCCDYPSGAENVEELVARAEFAMYQAVNTHSREAVMFSAEVYEGKQEEFRRTRAVHDVLDQNSIDYYFQPIVNARNGKIFGYEALMRPVSDMQLQPLDVLEVARKENCLGLVEMLTISNVMRKIEENLVRLDGRRVFVNTIPNMLLPQSDFDALADRYGSLFGMVIMEITEESNFNDELFSEFSRRCESVNCSMALDDYGTGYSNETNLLKFQPTFIKIDKELITNIDTDEKKRTLVSGVISFAKKHGIKIIAEGVETQKELEYAIAADVDFIQGFVTARPLPVPIDRIAPEVSDAIIALNLKKQGRNGDSIYETTSAGEVDILELALSGYSELYVRHTPVVITGSATKTAEVLITVADDFDCDITIRDCSLFRHPYIFVCGENSRARVRLEGKNKFFGGFCVPGGSELDISGGGSCDMAIHTTDPIAFGCGEEKGFGKIHFGVTGKCTIAMVGDTVIGFGGYYSSIHSEISISDADIEIEQKAKSSVTIGALSGISMIGVTNSKIKITNDGNEVLGIGNHSGTLDAELSCSEIQVGLTGDKVTAVGMLTAGNGSVNITDGCTLEICENAKSLIGVGARDGSFEIYCCDSIIDVAAEGNEAIGIGDIEGETAVYIKNASIVSAKLLSISPKAISTGRGQVFIDSGNIISDAPIETARNSRGEELRLYKVATDREVVIENYDNGDSGRYEAPVYEKRPEYVGVYLPGGVLPKDLELLK